MKKNVHGFTLIELLVVISIMAIVAVALFLNLGSFDEDANLKNEAFNIQSYLRLAQANAQAGVKCPDDTTSVSWSVSFNDRAKDAIKLGCHDQSGQAQEARVWSLNFPAYVDSIKGLSGSSECLSSLDPGNPEDPVNYIITITFASLTGKTTFADGDKVNECLKNSKNMVITVRKKLDSEDFKTVTINSGGSIDVE